MASPHVVDLPHHPQAQRMSPRLANWSCHLKSPQFAGSARTGGVGRVVGFGGIVGLARVVGLARIVGLPRVAESPRCADLPHPRESPSLAVSAELALFSGKTTPSSMPIRLRAQRSGSSLHPAVNKVEMEARADESISSMRLLAGSRLSRATQPPPTHQIPASCRFQRNVTHHPRTHQGVLSHPPPLSRFQQIVTRHPPTTKTRFHQIVGPGRVSPATHLGAPGAKTMSGEKRD